MRNERAYYKNRTVLRVVALVLFFIFSFATVMGWEAVFNLTSPVLSCVLAVLIYISFNTTGKYYRSALCFFLGITVWFMADCVWAYCSFQDHVGEVLQKISDNLYLVPDYVFLLGVIVYARDVLKKSDYQKIAVNAFILAVITSIFGYRFAMGHHNFGNHLNLELFELTLYFFVSVFTIVSMGMIVNKTGWNVHSRSFKMVCISGFIFSVGELRYTILMILNREPENIYLDIVYTVCILLYSFAWSRPDIKDKVIIPIEKVNKREKYVPWINGLLMICLAIILYAVNYFDIYLVFCMVIASMAYVIMCKTVQANALAEELIARQKDETARLERMVAEKTKELIEMNKHLEYISNTDALTGLYNRRYGLDYLSELVRDGDNYPIALYSLDLNYFKPINDNYGHDMGDVVLKEVGRRLSRLGQSRCTAIRVGGDEFLVVFKNATNDVAIRGIGDLICEKMDAPIEATVVTEENETKSHTFQIAASIGIAIIPHDTNDIEELYKKADDALYTVKHTSEKSSYLMYSEMESFINKMGIRSEETDVKDAE